jgi:hypothetical protein
MCSHSQYLYNPLNLKDYFCLFQIYPHPSVAYFYNVGSKPMPSLENIKYEVSKKFNDFN